MYDTGGVSQDGRGKREVPEISGRGGKVWVLNGLDPFGV